MSRGHTYTDDELFAEWQGLNGAKRERLRWIALNGHVAWNTANRQHRLLADKGLVEMFSSDIKPLARLTPMGYDVLQVAKSRGEEPSRDR